MATGILGTNAPSATTNTTVYTVPTGYYSVFNVSFTNTGASPITIRLAVSTTASPAASEWLEYGATVIPNGVFERTGLVAQANRQVVVWVSATGTNVNVYGIETSTS